MSRDRRSAQTLQNSGPNRTNVQLGFIGVVSNSVLITVMGFGSTTLSSATNSAYPVHARGTIHAAAIDNVECNDQQ